LPVLERGITVSPSLTVGPVLTELQPSAVGQGELVTLIGERLGDPSLAVLVADGTMTGFPAQPRTLAVTRDASGVHFHFPNDPANYLPGLKTISARIDLPSGHLATSEARPLALLP